MANYKLTVEERTQTGKSYARKLRTSGKIPAVVYGAGKESTAIEVDVREVERALAASGSLIDLDLAGAKRTVLVKDMHRDPVRGTLQHVDFHEVDLTKKLEVTVPIRVVGEDQRPSDGGVVQTLLWEVTVLCLPTDIPEFIAVDVSDVELDHTVTVAELELPEGIEVLADEDESIVKIGLPAAVDLGEEAEEGDEPAEGEAVAEGADSEGASESEEE